MYFFKTTHAPFPLAVSNGVLDGKIESFRKYILNGFNIILYNYYY